MVKHSSLLWTWWNKESVNLEDVFEMFFTGKTYRSMPERSDQKSRNLSFVSSFNNSKSIARKSDFRKEKRRETRLYKQMSVKFSEISKIELVGNFETPITF